MSSRCLCASARSSWVAMDLPSTLTDDRTRSRRRIDSLLVILLTMSLRPLRPSSSLASSRTSRAKSGSSPSLTSTSWAENSSMFLERSRFASSAFSKRRNQLSTVTSSVPATTKARSHGLSSETASMAEMSRSSSSAFDVGAFAVTSLQEKETTRPFLSVVADTEVPAREQSRIFLYSVA